MSSLINFLFGLFLLSITVFRHEVFYVNDLLLYIFKTLVVVGFSLVFYSGAQLVSRKGWHGLVLMVVLESVIGAAYRYISYSQVHTLPVSVFEFMKGVYEFGYMNVVQYDENVSKFDKELQYLFKSGSAEFNNWEFSSQMEINRLGLRDSDKAVQAPEAIFLGDSYTMGWGTLQDDTYPHQFEALSGLKCLNAGVSSYGTAREYMLLKRLPKEKCQVLFIQYCYNDLVENYLFSRNGEQLAEKKLLESEYYKNVRINRLVKNYYPIKNLYWVVRRASLGLKFSLGGAVKQGNKASEEALPDDHGPLFINVLREIRNIYEGPIVIYYMGRPVDPTISDQLARAISMHPELNVQWLDMRDAKLNEQDYFLLDMHLTRSGNQKVARRLWKFVSEKNLLMYNKHMLAKR